MRAFDSFSLRACAAAGIAACLGDLFMTWLLGSRYPGYDSLVQPMSVLGEKGSPVILITSTWWVIMGLLFIAWSYGFYRAFSDEGRPARIAAWMIALYGAGEGLGSALVQGSGAGLFATPGAVVHNLLGTLGVAGAVSVPLLMMRIYDSKRSRWWYSYCWFTTLAGLCFLALFCISTLYPSGGIWLLLYAGLWQRLFMATYYALFVCLAVMMLIRRTGAPAQRARQ